MREVRQADEKRVKIPAKRRRRREVGTKTKAIEKS